LRFVCHLECIVPELGEFNSYLQNKDQMTMNYFLTYLLAIFSLSSYGQTKLISGKVMISDFPIENNLEEHEFWNASEAVIIGNDSIRLGIADKDGIFEMEIPDNIQFITVALIGMYPEKIELNGNCDYFEIILLPDAIYDFVTLRKEERLRKKDRERLFELYREAYRRKLFKLEKPCR